MEPSQNKTKNHNCVYKSEGRQTDESNQNRIKRKEKRMYKEIYN